MTVIIIGPPSFRFPAPFRGLLVLGYKHVHYRLNAGGRDGLTQLPPAQFIVLFSILIKDMLRFRDLVSNQPPLHRQGDLLWFAGSSSVTVNVKLL